MITLAEFVQLAVELVAALVSSKRKSPETSKAGNNLAPPSGISSKGRITPVGV